MSGPQIPSESRLEGHAIDPQRWVDLHGDYLYRYALRIVRRLEAAEDLVQEALLAAWRGRSGYIGLAQERSWLTAILKRKVIDWLRMAVRDRAAIADEPAEDVFNKAGKWRIGPKRWVSAAPDAGVERAEFWDVIRRCSAKLPPRLRDAFVLWHLDERAGDEVCQVIGVSRNNLWVMLHRARLGMWQCLTKNWYGPAPTTHKGG